MPGASSSLQRQKFGWSRAKKSFLTTSFCAQTEQLAAPHISCICTNSKLLGE